MIKHKMVLMIVLLLQAVLLLTIVVPMRANIENQSTPVITVNFQEAVTTPDQVDADPLPTEETEPPLSPVMSDAFSSDPGKYPPMPLMQWSPPLDENYSDNSMVQYDIAAGQELNLGKQDDMESSRPPASFIDGSSLQPSVETEELTPRDFSALTRITDTAAHPWSVNVRLLINWPNGAGSGCSGALVDPRWIVTAGHCIFSHDNGGWATGVRVVPGYDDGSEPYGAAFALHLFSWGGWIDNADFKWDIAHVRLDQPIGAMTGWHGYGYNSADSFFKNNTFHNPGYPGEGPYDFQHMYYWYGHYDDTETEIVKHDDLSYGGQSGSGSYYIDGNNRRIYAVLSHGTNTWTGQTRITGAKFDYILDTVLNDTPASPDLVPLDLRVLPSSITAGDRLSTLTYLVHNYASVAFNGTIIVRLYLSSNDNISSSDRLLGTAQLSGGLAAKHTATITADNLPVIPIDEEGNQWLGIILEVADYDTGNNETDGWHASPILIKPYVPNAPANVSATNAASPHEVVVAWSAAAGAVSYEVHRATSVGGAKTHIGTTTGSQFKDTSGIPGTMYYYFVRAVAANGQVSAFSQPAVGRRSFFQAFPVVLE